MKKKAKTAAKRKSAKRKPAPNMKCKPMTITQPIAWIEHWKKHMAKSGRQNLSKLIADAVNQLIFAEGGSVAPGDRPATGRGLKASKQPE